MAARVRRESGDGSVYQRSDGRWVGSVEANKDGLGRKRKYVYGRTRAEAKRKLRETQRRLASGLELPSERISTARYLRNWLDETLPGTVKETTADGYRWVLERYVIPAIGSVPLAKLAPHHVQKMLRAMESQGLSVATRRQTRAILRRALGHAERWGLVQRNAAALVEAPRAGGSRLDDSLSLDEAKALLAAAKQDRLGALVSVALATGLRKGEALALRWDDVDLKARTIRVTGTLKRRTGHGLVRDTPKTEHANRVVPLPAFSVAALRAHRQAQRKERLKAGSMWQDTGYVFTSPVGTPLDPANVNKHFRALCETAKIQPRRFHALRHSAATLMLANGAPLEVISKTLGHAGLSITADIYARVAPELQKQAASAMDRALAGS